MYLLLVRSYLQCNNHELQCRCIVFILDSSCSVHLFYLDFRFLNMSRARQEVEFLYLFESGLGMLGAVSFYLWIGISAKSLTMPFGNLHAKGRS